MFDNLHRTGISHVNAVKPFRWHPGSSAETALGTQRCPQPSPFLQRHKEIWRQHCCQQSLEHFSFTDTWRRKANRAPQNRQGPAGALAGSGGSGSSSPPQGVPQSLSPTAPLAGSSQAESGTEQPCAPACQRGAQGEGPGLHSCPLTAVGPLPSCRGPVGSCAVTLQIPGEIKSPRPWD